MKQERETVEGFRTGSEPVVAGKISQGSRGNREGGRTCWDRDAAQPMEISYEGQQELK